MDPPRSTGQFGATLRRLRERRGLSQSGLARSIGLSSSTVNMLESEARHPSRETVLALARALELDPAETDDLLVAGIHLPTAYVRLDPEGLALLRAVAVTLTDDGVPEARRRQLVQLVELALQLCRATDE